MRNAPTRVAMKPRSNFTAPVFPCVYYKMHEGTGLVIADSLGNGPDFTVSAGTPLATNVGFFTPPESNTTVWAACTVANDTDSYLRNLFDMASDYSNILIGLDYELGADIATATTLFSMGKPLAGIFALKTNATEILNLIYRGVGSATNQTMNFVTDLTGTGRSQILLDIAKSGANTFNVSCYINGSLAASVDGDWTNSSGTGPLAAADFGDGWAIGGLVQTTIGGNKTELLNAGAGGSGKLGRLFAIRLTEAHTAIGQKVALDLWRDRGEFPRSLAGL